MQRALELAAKANHGTSPNPMVGAAIVKGGDVMAEGFHRRAGGPHAEVFALRQAGMLARGATLYVTLEPCAHRGRTGPCTEAIISAGIANVVIALEDPDPRVSGAGIARLRAAGVLVRVGDGAAASEALNPRWLAGRRHGRPFVALKYAATLDGKIASRRGDSRWITGEEARLEAHRLRGAYDAIAVGAGTVIKDNPRLTARLAGGRPARRQPVRVVVDGKLRISPTAHFLDVAEPGRALVVTTTSAYAQRGKRLKQRGVEVLALRGSADGRVSMSALLRGLGARGITSVLVEGGGDLGWGMVKGGFVDYAYAFIAPRMVGGSDAPTPVDGRGFESLATSLPLRFVASRRLGDDMLLEAVAA